MSDSTKTKQTSIGGIWFSQKRPGMLLMTIEIDGQKQQFVAFKNDFKKGAQPDFKVFKNRTPSSASSVPPVETRESVESAPAPVQSTYSEDVPF